MFNIYKLIKSSILKLNPYQSARKIGGIGHTWLNANESPFSDTYKFQYNQLNRYPEPQPTKIIQHYSKYSGTKIDQILVTRGADEGIDLLIKAFCEPIKEAIIFCPPTYEMYGITSKINAVKSYIVPMLNNWQLNIESICNTLHNVKIIFICRPNNPTGNLINKETIVNLLKIVNNNIIVVIDEAYIEFCIKDTLISWIAKYPNLVILRTLSKAFGLAGLRCGFIIANNKIIKLLNNIISPYPIPTPVSYIANKALSDYNVNLMKKKISEIKKNRILLCSELSTLHYVNCIFPSEANYILVKFHSVEKIFKFLSSKGIIVRDQSAKLYLKGCLRISIGSKMECYKLINELKNLSKT